MAYRWLRALPAGFVSLFASIYFIVIGCGGGTVGATPPPAPAAPAVTSVTPATVPAGSAAFTLQINGSGFVSGSVASWNGTNLSTTYVSATELTAAVPASLAAGGGTFSIAVVNPDGQKSTSTNSSVVVDNPVPAIVSLSPVSGTAGAGALEVVVTGTGFIPSSVASFAGKARSTTVKSSTQLTVALTAADLATAGTANVTVANPPPGGGASAPAPFTIYQPPPMITGVMPASLVVGSPDTPVSIMGTGFTPGSMVLASGYQLVPVSITPTAINVTIPASELNYAAPLILTVQTPDNVSNSFSLPLLNPVPVIQSLSPQIVTAGSPGFSLTIPATGVFSYTQVNVNGAAVAPPFSTNPFQVPIPASALAQVGTVSISLTNPPPGGGTSNIATLQVIAGSNYLRTVNLPANSLEKPAAAGDLCRHPGECEL
jgi:hypothetical protein